MRERVKMFTFVIGHGETVVDPPYEDRINQWLSEIDGEITNVTQTESTRNTGGHHVTVCVWYLPATGGTAVGD